jgi:hypothetical protein
VFDAPAPSIRRLCLILCIAIPQPPHLSAQEPSDPGLAGELIKRGSEDQAVRDTVLQRMQAGTQVEKALMSRMNSVDSANLVWLRQVVDRYGWPGRKLVGAEASHYAFLIVQHAVSDTGFQARVLPLMERMVTGGEVDGKDVALLSDRLDVQRGRPQRYGTQARLNDGMLIFHPIEDSVRVDARRAKLGLPPLAEYARQLGTMYTAQPDTVIMKASGTFTVRLPPQPARDSGSSFISRYDMVKTFEGDLQGSSTGVMMAVTATVEGSAGYVAIEQVKGTLMGRRGTFVLQHSGLMTQGKPALTITVIPDSGTDQLTGLSGTMGITVEEGVHRYVMEYRLPQR